MSNNPNPLVQWMQQNGIRVTRKNYLELAFLGEPPDADDIGPELELELDQALQDDSEENS